MAREYHNLKIQPIYYRTIEKGLNNFEVRFNDRNFKVGDVLRLQEWVNGVYTGRYIMADVTYILDDPLYCKEGYVIMARANIKVFN